MHGRYRNIYKYKYKYKYEYTYLYIYMHICLIYIYIERGIYRVCRYNLYAFATRLVICEVKPRSARSEPSTCPQANRKN